MSGLNSYISHLKSATNSKNIVHITLSGSHMYGYASPDSDYDFAGVFVLDPVKYLGFKRPKESIHNPDWNKTGLDYTLHEFGKVVSLIMNKNGNSLEMLNAEPVDSSFYDESFMQEMRDVCSPLFNKHFYHHYSKYAESLYKKFVDSRNIKHALGAIRTLLTGAHALNTEGEVLTNYVQLLHTDSGSSSVSSSTKSFLMTLPGNREHKKTVSNDEFVQIEEVISVYNDALNFAHSNCSIEYDNKAANRAAAWVRDKRVQIIKDM